MDRVHFADTVARGRDYYTPYRAMLPRKVDQLLVAGRHYSATEGAQKLSREIPPCMSMGQSAGVAAALELQVRLLLLHLPEPHPPCLLALRLLEKLYQQLWHLELHRHLAFQ